MTIFTLHITNNLFIAAHECASVISRHFNEQKIKAQYNFGLSQILDYQRLRNFHKISEDSIMELSVIAPCFKLIIPPWELDHTYRCIYIRYRKWITVQRHSLTLTGSYMVNTVPSFYMCFSYYINMTNGNSERPFYCVNQTRKLVLCCSLQGNQANYRKRKKKLTRMK